MPTILIVEDEPAIAESIEYALELDGFGSDWCQTGQGALERLQTQAFDLVILDVGLPDGSGFDICKKIRQQSQVPVVFLTARSSEIDRVVGLEIGADDYVVKPFSPRELTARVKAILRRFNQAAPPGGPADFGSTVQNSPEQGAQTSQCQQRPLVLDEDRCTLLAAGHALDLTRTEFLLLKCMMARPQWVFSRDQLMEAAWEDPASATDRTVDAHIKTIRAKIRTSGYHNDPIKTHRGLGYSFQG